MFASPLLQTLKQNHPGLHNYYSVKNMLKLLTFKWLLSKLLLETEWSEIMLIWWLLLETEWSEIMLIWWFVSIKFIKSFLKFSFFNISIQTIPFVILTTMEKTVPSPSTDIIMVALLCFPYHLLFCPFFKLNCKPKV